MPTVSVHPDELRRLTGTDRDDDELKADLFGLGLEYEGEDDAGAFELEFAPDRLDRLSAEGIARSLRYHYAIDRGIDIPRTNSPDWIIEVDPNRPEERAIVTGAVIRDVSISESGLKSLIQLQEKLHATIGRSRQKGSIGIHDLSMVKGTSGSESARPKITYTGIDPDGDQFVPLESEREYTPGEVLSDHPTGRLYAELVAEYDQLPAFYDDLGLFSFPPIINGRRTELTGASRDILIEMTGTDQWTVDRMLSILCYALDARGATIEAVTIKYPDGRELTRPDFETDVKRVDHQLIERTLGIDLDIETVVDSLQRSGLDVEVAEVGDDETAYDVEIPSYRVDVIHPIDLVDDVGRAYGFNKLVPKYPDVSTVGSRHERTRLEDATRSVLVGLGFEDLLNFHLISEEENFDRMKVDQNSSLVGGGEPVSIREPYSEDYTIVRTWALPSLLMVLESNTHRAYPQHLAEIGLAMHLNDSEETGVEEWRTVAGVLARTDATYEDAKGILEAIARNFAVTVETPPTDHPTFISGRAATIVINDEPVGVVGEIHPVILVDHDLEVPVVAFEFRLEALERSAK